MCCEVSTLEILHVESCGAGCDEQIIVESDIAQRICLGGVCCEVSTLEILHVESCGADRCDE